MAGRFNADTGGGFRGGTASFGSSADASTRGGTGSDGQDMTTSNQPGTPHSIRGFKRALLKTERSGNRLKDMLPSPVDTSGTGYRKPNYFAQGGKRHGMHIGSGAPYTSPASGDSGEGFGGD